MRHYDAFITEAFCCCFSIRTGSLMIGYARLLVNLSLAVFMQFHFEETCKLLAVDLSLQEPLTIYLFYVILGCIFLNIIFNIILLFGIHGNKIAYVTSYIYFSIFIIGITVLNYLAQLAMKQIWDEVHISVGYILQQLYFLYIILQQHTSMENKIKPDKVPIMISNA